MTEGQLMLRVGDDTLQIDADGVEAAAQDLALQYDLSEETVFAIMREYHRGVLDSLTFMGEWED